MLEGSTIVSFGIIETSYHLPSVNYFCNFYCLLCFCLFLLNIVYFYILFLLSISIVYCLLSIAYFYYAFVYFLLSIVYPCICILSEVYRLLYIQLVVVFTNIQGRVLVI